MDRGLIRDKTQTNNRDVVAGFNNLVLDKDIFSRVFEKDIRRIYIYKKSERIAKAIHIISPMLKDSRALCERLEQAALALVDAAVLAPSNAREAITRELLALGSLLSVAKAGGHLSPMNTEIIMSEAHNLLKEVASYEDPHLSLEEAPTLAALARDVSKEQRNASTKKPGQPFIHVPEESMSKGHVSDNIGHNGRRGQILSVLKDKGHANIKDISMRVRDISEKTIQRELQLLVQEGKVSREGNRRWTTYTLSSNVLNRDKDLTK